MIWDRGTWQPEGDPNQGLAKGRLNFTLDGEKLHGGWHLVRMHGRPGEKRTNWLLIKMHDDAARGATARCGYPGGGAAVGRHRPLDLRHRRGQRRQPGLAVQSWRRVERIRRESTARIESCGKNVWHEGNIHGQAAQQRAQAETRAAARRPAARKAAARPGAKPGSKPGAKAKKKKPGGAPLPVFVPPSLATLRAQAPEGAGWVHEIKFDGYRIQARLDHGAVRLLTRKGLDWTEKFPNVAHAVAALPATTALIDGEIVIEDEHGISSFSGLQAALKAGERERFVYYVFDLLHLDGENLAALPLIQRKHALATLLGWTVGRKTKGPIQYSEDFARDGSVMLRQACALTLEGIVSKREDAPYRSGRSETFIKSKCANAQEFVVGGYSPSTVMPHAVGALVVGYYDQGRLIYAGRMGTGYTRALAQDLWKRLHPLEIPKPPFDQMPATERRRDVTWVRPTLVVEAQFRGWTGDGMVRQAAFKGVREDKPSTEVVREIAAMPNSKSDRDTPARGATIKVAAHAAKSSAVKRAKRPAASRAAARRPKGAKSAQPSRTAPAGAKDASAKRTSAKPWDDTDVRFTHPDRVYWVDVGVTKQDLGEFYRDVWDWMAPQVVGRPLSLVRCPDGTKGQCFFQKHASGGLTDHNLRTVIDDKGRQIIAIEAVEGLLSLVQAGVLEVHVRGSMIDSLDRCDRLVFDLDPGDGIGWSDIVAAAQDVRERLADIDLETFVKLSGGKGLHVVMPIAPADWDTTKTFVQAFAQAMAADEPDRYLAKMTKSARNGKIFVDYLRNSLEQTSVAAYSTRARTGAPVSVPVSWQELGRTTGGNQYTVLNLMKRLMVLKKDPWLDIGRVRQKLPDLAALRKR